jgi:hypothetical protein
MKTKALFLYLSLFSFGVIIFTNSCSSEQVISSQESAYNFLLKSDTDDFYIKNETDLIEFVKHKAVHENIQIETVSFEKVADTKEVYQVVKAQYFLEDNRLVNVVIPLNSVNEESHLLTFVGDCVMTCTPKRDCDKSEQIITKKCGGQICSCDNEGGGAVSAVLFKE